MRTLLAHRDVRLYLAGQVFSLFGDSCLWLAMGIWVKTLTHSNAAAGLTFFFFTAPALSAPALSLAADRFRRRPLLIATNAATGAVVLALLAVHGVGQVWLIYLVMALYGLSHAVVSSAQSALLSVMIPADLLADANGALRTAQEGLRLIGPLAGAGLFVAVGAHAIVILDAATFTVPVICLAALRISEPAPRPMARHWSKELTAGIRHVIHTPDLRHAVAASAIAFAVIGFDETTPYAIAGSGLHRPPAFVGVLVAIQGAGALIGGATAAPLLRRLGEAHLITAGFLLLAASAVLQMPPDLAPVIAGAVLLGAAFPWVVVAFITLLQRLTPDDLQGRAYSAATTMAITPQTISIALGAALIAVTGYRPLLAIMAIVMTLAAAYLLTRTRQQRPPPPATPASSPAAAHNPHQETTIPGPAPRPGPVRVTAADNSRTKGL